MTNAPLRKVLRAEVCISVAGAIAESYLECGHVIRFAGMKAMGTQGAKARHCPRCASKPAQGSLI